MKIRLSFYLFFSWLTFLPSCRILQPEFRNIENLRVDKLGMKGSDLKMNLLLYNPNSFQVTLKKAEGQAWIDENLIGRFTIDSTIRVPAREEFRLPVNLRADLGKILKSSLRTVLSESIQLKLEGKARLGTGPISINYPFQYSKKHSFSELLK